MRLRDIQRERLITSGSALISECISHYNCMVHFIQYSHDEKIKAFNDDNITKVHIKRSAKRLVGVMRF